MTECKTSHLHDVLLEISHSEYFFHSSQQDCRVRNCYHFIIKVKVHCSVTTMTFSPNLISTQPLMQDTNQN